ncbi:MAG: IclR family transcriptional regulator domain-containing protein [Candidatus Malihini olakiniferum]
MKLESPQAVVIHSWEGKRLSIHSSGLGKALIAWLSEEQLAALLPEEQPLRVIPILLLPIFRCSSKKLTEIRRCGWGTIIKKTIQAFFTL